MSSILPLILNRDKRERKNDNFEKTENQLNVLANLPSVFNKYPEVQKEGELKGHIKENHFEVLMDVQQFRPNEIIVKTDKTKDKLFVIVEAKHNEREDCGGYVSRQFVRKYSLPRSCDANKVIAQLSTDGVLVVEASLENTSPKQNERSV